MKKILPLLPFLLLMVTGCKKENEHSNVTQIGVSPISIPSSAAGTLSANNYFSFDNLPGQKDTFLARSEQAEFNNNSSNVTAGLVTMNGDTLVLDTPGQVFYQVGQINYPALPNSTNWNVRGNSSNNVPAFTYTDNNPFPTLSGLSLPDTISINSGLTLNYSITGAYNVRSYQLLGVSLQNSASVNFIGGAATTVSFSASQIRQATTGGPLVVFISLTKVTPYTVGAQTYYFVNTTSYQLSTYAR